MIKNILLCVCSLMLILLQGCSSFKGWGSDFGEGLLDEAKTSVDTVGFELVKGLRESLTSDESKQKLTELIDSLITHLGESSNKQLTGIRDSVLNDYITTWLQDELLGDKTSDRLVQLRNSIFGPYLKDYINDITYNLGTNIFNDSTLARIGAIRDTLLGNQSNEYLRAIVDSALITIAFRLDKDINPLLRDNLSFVEKNATWLLILVGIITLVIIWFVWKQKEKYLQMTKMLTYQISEVPDKILKEDLKNSISKNAKTIGLEDELRTLLDKYGLLHLDDGKGVMNKTEDFRIEEN